MYKYIGRYLYLQLYINHNYIYVFFIKLQYVWRGVKQVGGRLSFKLVIVGNIGRYLIRLTRGEKISKISRLLGVEYVT